MELKNYQQLIFDLIINLSVEQEAFHNLIVGEYIRHTNEKLKDINAALNELRIKARSAILADVKKHYGDFGDIDDLINSALN